MSKLKEWADKAHLDPNDPGNAQLFHVLSQSVPAQNEITTTDNELDFCDAEEILNNPRLRLLRLRDQGEPEFRGYQMVPLCEKLIHPEIFKVKLVVILNATGTRLELTIRPSSLVQASSAMGLIKLCRTFQVAESRI